MPPWFRVSLSHKWLDSKRPYYGDTAKLLSYSLLLTGGLSDADLDAPLMLLNIALYMYLSTVVGRIYGALQTTSVHNWDGNFIRNVAFRLCAAVHWEVTIPWDHQNRQLLETGYGPHALRNETVIVTGFRITHWYAKILIPFTLTLVLHDFHLYMAE